MKTPRMQAAEDEQSAAFDAMIHSDDPEKRCRATLYRAVAVPFRDALTQLIAEGNDIELIGKALIYTSAGIVAVGSAILAQRGHHDSLICHVSKAAHDLAHVLAANPSTAVTVSIDTENMTIEDA